MNADEQSVHWSVRAVLVFGIIAGVGYVIDTVLTNPVQIGIASDVYYHTANGLLAGENIYEVTPPDTPGYHYLYPPIVVVSFLPHALLGSETGAFFLQSVLNVGAGVGTGIVILRALSRRSISLERVDRVLIVGFTAFSVWSSTQLLQGQVTLWLAFAFAIGFDALERGNEDLAGVAFAGAALVKLFPAAIGLWLVRQRSWRAVGVAIATGVSGLLAGLVVFGWDLTRQYVTEVLVGRFEHASFEGTPDPERGLVTVRRQLLAVFDVDPALLTPLAVLVLVPFVLICYRRIDSDEKRLAAILATILATVLVMPFQALYFSLLAYPAVLLLVLLPAGPARWLLVGGTLCTYVSPGPESVEIVLQLVPGTGGIEAGAMSAAEAVFTVIQIPTIGMWLMLFACVLIHVDRRVSPRSVLSTIS